MFPMALITGNTHVMKPSERDPGATMFMMQLAQDAGFPDGTVNVIHGAHAGFFIFSSILTITYIFSRFLSFTVTDAITNIVADVSNGTYYWEHDGCETVRA
jgi:hypothetical protein